VEAAAEIDAAGARLVIVTPQSAERAAAWRDEVSLGDALVIADPRRTLYKALGARRPKPVWMLRPRVAVSGVRTMLSGERPSMTKGDDALQLGVDVVVDRNGQIAFIHRASDPADRTPPADLIAVVRELNSSAGLPAHSELRAASGSLS
jgi:hypothetical protein